jgi:hypothetical protein
LHKAYWSEAYCSEGKVMQTTFKGEEASERENQGKMEIDSRRVKRDLAGLLQGRETAS